MLEMNRRTRGTINYICHLNKTCCTDKNIKKISTNVGGEKNREEKGREKKKNRETERKQRERERLREREREKKEKKYFWVSLAMFVYHDDGVLLVIECHDYTTMASHGMMDLP